MVFESELFIQYIRMHQLDKALAYKNQFIPGTLFKFFPLFEEYDNDTKAEIPDHIFKNSKRFTNLLDEKIWLSKYKTFNDPYEFKSTYYDNPSLLIPKAKIERAEEIIENTRNKYFISCFSDYVYENIPMWAYYSYNHQGYCLRFKVKNRDDFYRVSYVNQKAALTEKMLDELIYGYIDPNLKTAYKLNNTLIHLSFCTKFIRWQSEKEIRLIFEINAEESLGMPVHYSVFGLQIQDIFIGYKCSYEHFNRLLEIGKILNCNVYRMSPNEKSKYFRMEKDIVYKSKI